MYSRFCYGPRPVDKTRRGPDQITYIGGNLADIQDNHSPDEPTKKVRVTDFPEVRDKIVSFVEVIDATEGFGITIRFHDESVLHFDIETCIVITPVHSQWEQGEETILKQWHPIQSTVSDS